LDVANIIICGVEVDDLEGNEISSGDVHALVNRAIGTFAHGFEAPEELVYRRLGHHRPDQKLKTGDQLVDSRKGFRNTKAI
jgi:hypothetical protein